MSLHGGTVELADLRGAGPGGTSRLFGAAIERNPWASSWDEPRAAYLRPVKHPVRC